jgi:hypothetical protein
MEKVLFSIEKFAHICLAKDLNLLPLKNGKPTYGWEKFMRTFTDHRQQYDDGIGIMCGSISGSFEVIHLVDQMYKDKHLRENLYEDYIGLIPDNPYHKLISFEAPNGGCYFCYRCPGVVIPRSRTLLSRSNRTLIRTVGEGDYISISKHDVYYCYDDLYNITEITPKERSIILDAAEKLNIK